MSQEKAYVGNCADMRQVKEGGRKEKERRRQEIKDIKAIMAISEGRRFFWRLINEICHYDTISAQHSGSMTYLLEGERNVGRLVKADIYEANIDAYHLMEREHIKAKMEMGNKDTDYPKKEDANV